VLGTALSFGEFDSFLNRTLGDVAWIILLELGGAVLLMVIATWLLVLNRRDALELTAVREKAELMEEINRQQQSLAHTERLQQLGVMTSGMVHEFNNMLTPIMSQSMLLLEQLGDTDSPQFDSALDIYEASEKARDILKRMSHMSKKEGDLGFKILDLGALLRKTMALASMAKDPHIVQELTTPAEPVFVSGNEQLLTQAFLNLCINACQAMGTEGTLTVRATVERRSGHEYVLVEVLDTGTGISETVMGSMYQPFFTTKGEQGTGLGLAICQKIIETHKGTIAAANRPEGGAVFTVRLPTVTLPEE
jgi:signal transduction histidine kinase